MESHRKKILYIVTKSNMGGAQRYVFELATSLDPATYEVVVAFGGNGPLKSMLETRGIRTQIIKNFERDIGFQKEIGALVELWKIIRKENPDIVHLNSSKAGGSGALIARLLGVPRIIFTAHGWPFFEKRGMVWRFNTWFFSFATALLAHKVILVSKHDLKHAHMYGLSKKLTVIQTGVPTIPFISRESARAKLFTPSLIEAHASDVWLISTGEHTGNKNLMMLLCALHHIEVTRPGSKLFLTLMSDGEERSDLQTYVNEHNLCDRVAFTGFVDDARMYLKAFDVFVLPSKKEGLPYGLLEAGEAGLASIGSNVGGIPEVIENTYTGLLINPSETESLASAITTLVDSDDIRTSYGKELKQKIDTGFRLEDMITKTHRLY